MKPTTIYYLFRDTVQTGPAVKFYVTDYKEQRPDGKYKIDGFGWLDVECIYRSPVKAQCWEKAQQLFDSLK